MTHINMAPDVKRILEHAPEIRLWYARTDVPIFELYFRTMKYTDESLILNTALQKSERRIQEIFIDEKLIPDTFRKFKFRLYKIAQREAIKEILINRQRIEESTVTWLNRTVHFLAAFEDRDIALFFLKETSIYKESKDIVKKHLESCKSYLEMREEVKYRIPNEDSYLNKDNTKKVGKQKVEKSFKKPELKKSKEINVNFITKKNSKNKTDDKMLVKIANKEYEAIADTGSQVNIISQELLIENSFKPYSIPKVSLKNIIGNITFADTAVDIPTTIEGMLIHLNFLIIKTENKNTILIGNETLKRVQKHKKELTSTINEFPSVFDMKISEGYKGMMCNIETIPNKKVYIKQRRIPQAMQEGTKLEIEKMLAEGVIEKSSSSWCNPIRPVPKQSGEVRLTVNMQFLNNLVQDNNYTVPHIQGIIEKTQGYKWFTVIDLKDGYFQIMVNPNDKFKTAFQFNNQLYQFVRMPQGFKNSPAIFQQIMDTILQEFIDNGCNVYLDDIIVYAKTEKEHDNLLRKILKKLEVNNFKINIGKMQYKQQEVKLLGAIINGITQRPIPEKQSKILTFQVPKTKKELQRFLGFANFYRKYLKKLGEISEPLYNLLKSKNETLIWTNKEEEAFNKIKNMINSDIAVHIPDYSKSFVLSTDASNTGISAVLQQEINNELKVIDWGSKKLTPAEQKYGITEKEFLAMAWGIEHFDYYLRGRKFKVRTDHSALLSIKTKQIFGSLKLERMRERLQEYDFTLEYIKGEELIEADAISRIHEEPADFTEFEKMNKRFLTGQNDEHYWKLKTEEIRIIPKIKERAGIIKNIHKELGHRGRECIMKELVKKYYWPNVTEMISEIIKTCDNCIKNTQKTEGGETFISSNYPNEIAAADLFFVTQQDTALTYIDYFTRIAKIKPLQNKSSSSIKRALEEIFEELGPPNTLITDNGKEFANNEVKELLRTMNVHHHKTSVEKHQSNGRIERFHRTLWQMIRKTCADQDEKIIDGVALKELVEKYNNTFHTSILTTPYEALNDYNNKDLKIINSNEGEYARRFKKLKRDKFNVGDKVYIENTAMEAQDKRNNLYEVEGIIKEVLEHDTYLINIPNTGKITKKSHSQLIKQIK